MDRSLVCTDYRAVQVAYSVPLPGTTLSVPMSDRVALYAGDTDESDIPTILAVRLWSRPELKNLIKVESVRPLLVKAYGPRPGRPLVPESVLVERRNGQPTGYRGRPGDWYFLADNHPEDLAESFACRADVAALRENDCTIRDLEGLLSHNGNV